MSRYPPLPPPVIGYASPANLGTRRWLIIPGSVLFVVFVGYALLYLARTAPAGHMIPLSEFAAQLRAGNVRQVTIADDELAGTLNSPVSVGSSATIQEFRVQMGPGLASNWPFINWVLDNRGSAEVVVTGQHTLLTILVPLIPWALIFLFIWFFVFRNLRKLKEASPQPIPVYVVDRPPAPPNPMSGIVR